MGVDIILNILAISNFDKQKMDKINADFIFCNI